MFEIADDKQLFESLCATIRTRIPRFKIGYKNKSKWQKFLAVILFFIRGNRYMKSIVTTLGTTVWFPSEEFVEQSKWRAFKILAHEYVHLLDRWKHPFLFDLFYVLPQILAILSLVSLMAFWFGWWWLFGLVALVFLAPMPSYGRAELEKRAYSMGIAINIWRHGSILDDYRDVLVGVFCGKTYYRMWPYEKDIRKWIEETERLVYNIDAVRPKGTVLDLSDAFIDVYEMLTGIEL